MKFYKENKSTRSAPACRWSRSSRCSSRCSTCCARTCGTDICPQTQARLPGQVRGGAPHLAARRPRAHDAVRPEQRRRLPVHPRPDEQGDRPALIVLLSSTSARQLASSLVMQSPTMDKTQRRMMMLAAAVLRLDRRSTSRPACSSTGSRRTLWTIGQQFRAKTSARPADGGHRAGDRSTGRGSGGRRWPRPDAGRRTASAVAVAA